MSLRAVTIIAVLMVFAAALLPGEAMAATATATAAAIDGKCKEKAENGGAFALGICIFESALDHARLEIQKAMQPVITNPVRIALTIYLSVLGVGFLTGMVNMNSKEAMIAVLKIAFVLLFATNVPLSNKYGYELFHSFAEDSSAIMLKALSGSKDGLSSGPDAKLKQGVENSTKKESGDAEKSSLIPTMPQKCMNALFIMMGIVLLFVPSLVVLVVFAFVKYFIVFARACFGYLSALFYIAFLWIFAPFFCCFMLFNSTRELFDKWVSYLISYSLQMMVVFAFFALYSAYKPGDFLLELGKLVMLDPVKTKTLGLFNSFPLLSATDCTLCYHTIENDGALKCTDTPPKPMPFLAVFTETKLISWIVIKALTALILVMVFEDLLKRAPKLGQRLAGAPAAVMLGGDDVGAHRPGQLNFVGFRSAMGALDHVKRKGIRSTVLAPMGKRGEIMNVSIGKVFWEGEDDADDRALLMQRKKAQRRAEKTLMDARRETVDTYDDLVKARGNDSGYDGIKKAENEYKLERQVQYLAEQKFNDLMLNLTKNQESRKSIRKDYLRSNKDKIKRAEDLLGSAKKLDPQNANLAALETAYIAALNGERVSSELLARAEKHLDDLAKQHDALNKAYTNAFHDTVERNNELAKAIQAYGAGDPRTIAAEKAYNTSRAIEKEAFDKLSQQVKEIKRIENLYYKTHQKHLIEGNQKVSEAVDKIIQSTSGTLDSKLIEKYRQAEKSSKNNLVGVSAYSEYMTDDAFGEIQQSLSNLDQARNAALKAQEKALDATKQYQPDAATIAAEKAYERARAYEGKKAAELAKATDELEKQRGRSRSQRILQGKGGLLGEFQEIGGRSQLERDDYAMRNEDAAWREFYNAFSAQQAQDSGDSSEKLDDLKRRADDKRQEVRHSPGYASLNQFDQYQVDYALARLDSALMGDDANAISDALRTLNGVAIKHGL